MKKQYLLLFFVLLPTLSISQYSERFPLDKQAHFLAGSTLSAVTYSLILKKTKDHKKAFLYSLVTPFVFGFAKEFIDGRRNRNDFDVKDLGATVLGGLAVSVTLEVF